MEISSELKTGIAQWTAAANAIVDRVGGIGAQVVGTTPDGREHVGTLESVASCQGLIVRSAGKRYMIATHWERYDCDDPGALLASIRAGT